MTPGSMGVSEDIAIVIVSPAWTMVPIETDCGPEVPAAKTAGFPFSMAGKRIVPCLPSGERFLITSIKTSSADSSFTKLASITIAPSATAVQWLSGEPAMRKSAA